jgi:DNA-binding response OmpR family regulator
VPPTILVIEDEPGIVDFLERGLVAQGFEVRSALDGESGAEQALRDAIDLVVLDMMLPVRSGLEVLREVHKAKPELPVIVLTARAEVEHRVEGLDTGAVDYLVKPFSLRELVARINAQLRVASQSPRTTLTGAGVEVNLITREVLYDGELVRLSTTEFELLSYLIRNRGQALPREQILRAVWGYDYDPGTNVVDVYVGYLRRKLRAVVTAGQSEQGTRHESPIVTVRSIGYRFNADA